MTYQIPQLRVLSKLLKDVYDRDCRGTIRVVAEENRWYIERDGSADVPSGALVHEHFVPDKTVTYRTRKSALAIIDAMLAEVGPAGVTHVKPQLPRGRGSFIGTN